MELSEIGVTEKKEKQFNSKGIYTAEDLTKYIPRKYYDFTKITGILPPNEISVFYATVKEVKANHGAIPVLYAKCETEDGKLVQVSWFHQNFLKPKIEKMTKREVIIAGKVTYDKEWRRYKIGTPLLFDFKSQIAMSIKPVYSKIKGMADDYLYEKLAMAIKARDCVTETLPKETVKTLDIMFLKEALSEIHFPQSMERLEKAKERMLYDDLIYFALRNEWNKENSKIKSEIKITNLSLAKKIQGSLPYSLTQDQRAAINTIYKTANEGRRINALLQGDVGSGKTIVAMLSMACFVSSGYQAALLAPTKILAVQHYNDLLALLKDTEYEPVYFGGELSAKDKKKALEKIKNGEARFIVGTHSLIGKSVEFENLGLAIIDEEHKFGVAQRRRIVEMSEGGVHSITMSATPIPRSLAKVIYGDNIELLTIKTMPQGRKPVKTGIAKSRNHIYSFLKKEIAAGHKAYIVCPMIDDNEDMEDVASVETISEEYRAALPDVKIATLTGKDKKNVTEETINAFKNGDTDILIATSVIEVGVNVPNATVIVISSADRFGLSSLHQLRGRVGRSSLQSYCVLECEKAKDGSNERLNAMVNTTDGFEIAKADLSIRGAGDFIGTKQSGNNKYVSLMLAYPTEYLKAKDEAKKILDLRLECKALDTFLDEKEKEAQIEK